jgi:sugar lactone lactonase YvrE
MNTIAGTGTVGGYFGDEQEGTFARLNYPADVSFDSTGGIIISDMFNNVIRMLDSDGLISTIAGDGTPGYFGDGGPATSAVLNSPNGISVDLDGKIYICDTGNYIIRMINTTGSISTVAGTPGFSASNGNGGPATSAYLSNPVGIYVDQVGRIYITDSYVIRLVDTFGKISIFAGTSIESGYSGDRGPSTSAQLDYCSGVSGDRIGRLFIADTLNHVIRVVDLNGTITTVAGNGTAGYSGDNGSATMAMLSYPYGVFVDHGGRIFIADSFNQVIRMVDSNGSITTIAGMAGAFGFSGDGRQATSARINSPRNVKVDPAGRVYVADSANSVIRMLRISTVQPPGLPINGTTSKPSLPPTR